MFCRRTRFVISILATLLVAAAPRASEVWPQWRGPSRDGKVQGTGWPSNLQGLEPLWRVELGPSYSGAIVAADRVFTTETIDEKDEAVSAFDRASGRLLWRKRWAGAIRVPFFAAANGSWIRSTPAWDGETLFVGGIREVVVALDGQTGQERWRIDFPTQQGREPPPFGFVCSPLVVGDHLYVEAAGTLRKLDKKDGREVWRSSPFTTDDVIEAGSFSSPVYATLAGQEQILVQTRTELKGVDPQEGRVLWSVPVPHFRGMNILTPTAVGDRVLTSSYRNGSYAFDVRRGESGFKVAPAWENTAAQGYMSSPLEIGGTLYLHLGNGRLSALDARTGEKLWTSSAFGKYWSIVAQGTRVLALDEGGELVLFDADRQAFRLLDRREIANSSTWAHLAVAGEELFVRELHALAAYRWPSSVAAEKVAGLFPAGAALSR